MKLSESRFKIIGDKPAGKYFVYKLIDPRGNKIFYIGKGPMRRVSEHMQEGRTQNCICRKCEIVRSIWKAGKVVHVALVFGTDNQQEALIEEGRLIETLSRTNPLCNIAGNDYQGRIPAPKPIPFMTADEHAQYLDRMYLSKQERTELIEEWKLARVRELRYQSATQMRQGRVENAAKLNEQIKEMQLETGLVYQERLL